MQWTQKSADKTSQPDWLEALRPEIIQRIRYYQDYLAQWGITAQTGIEQEFWGIKKGEDGREKNYDLEGYRDFFLDSPIVERMYREHRRDGSFPPHNGYEIVLGTGNGENKKSYPHPSLEPEDMVGASRVLNKVITREAGAKGLDGISFDPTNQGKRLYSQQVNMSLWANNKPSLSLLDESIELRKHCIIQLLETQNALIAFLTINPNAFKRFEERDPLGFYVPAKRICWQERKSDNPSVLLRTPKAEESNNEYTYIENRLGHSDVPAYVNILITLAGLARGVEQYIDAHNIETKGQLISALNHENPLYEVDVRKFPEYRLPRTQQEALQTTEKSTLAQDILGYDLYQKFIAGYKQHCVQSRSF